MTTTVTVRQVVKIHNRQLHLMLPEGFDYDEVEVIVMPAFEFKWNAGKKGVRFPKTFLNGYPKAETAVFTPADYDLFLTGEQEKGDPDECGTVKKW